MQNQMLVKNSKKIIIAILSFVLVMACVLFVVNNLKQETKQVQKMGVKVLNVSNNTLKNSTTQEGEIEETKEGEESTEVSKVAGNNMNKSNQKYETASSVYINQDNTVTLQIDGTDLVRYDRSTLTASSIVVKVGTNQVTPTVKNLTGPFPLIDGRSGVSYELELSGIPGDGVLSVVIPANTLYDAAGNPNEETQSTFDQEIIVDNTAPTKPTVTAAFRDGSGSYISGNWTNKEVSVSISSVENGSGVKNIQYRINGGSWGNWGTQINSNNGTYTSVDYFALIDRNDTVDYRVTDNVGNVSEISDEFNIKYDIAGPTKTSFEIKNLSATGYDVYVYGVTDNNGSGVKSVRFPTWTENNGQDDVIWGNGTLQEDGTTWVYRVDTTAHKNEAGSYTTHVYMYDNLENRTSFSAGTLTVPTVTATFNSNGGTAANPGTIVKPYNNDLGTLPTTSRTGYDFSGWWTSATGGQQISTTTKMPSSNVTYYAHWTAKNYTVTADANGGTIPTTSGWTVASGSATATKQVTYDSAYGTLPQPTRTGYEFKGWNGKNLFNPGELITGTNIVSDANGNISASNTTSDSTEWSYANSNLKTTLSAGTYTISFNFSTKSTSSYAEVRIYDDANNELLSKNLQNVDSASETFTLSSTKNIGIKLKLYNGVAKIQLEKSNSATSYEPYYVISTTNVTQDKDHTLYAKWEANKYTVTANANSGTIGVTTGWTGTGATATKQVTYDSAYGDLPQPTRTGYTFEGWNISSDGTGTTYTDSSKAYKQLNYIEATDGQYINTGYMVGKDTGIEADFQFTDLTQQQRVYGNSYNSNNAVLYDFYINSADSWAYAYNDTTGNWVHTGKAADMNKHNLKFNVTSGKVLIDDGATYDANISGSVNNTATSELRILMYNSKIKLYSFKVYENGSIVRNYVPAQRVSDNVVGMYETVTKTFLTNASGSGTFTAGTQGGVTSTTLVSTASNHNIYARWIVNQYTLTLNPNGGTYNNKTANSTLNIQYDPEVNLGYPTRSGYTFKQWKTSDGIIYDKNLLTGALAPEFKAPSTNANAGWRIASNSEPSGGARSIIDITNPPVEGITKGFEIKSGNKYDVCQDNVPVTIGNTYTMSVWAKGTGTLNLQVGNSSYGVKLIELNNVTEWTKYSYTFVAGTNGTANGNQTNIYFGNNTTVSGAIQICGMKLEENNGFSSLLWSNVPSTTSSPTLVAEWVPNKYKITLDNQSATTSGTTAAWYYYNTVNNNIYYYSDEACTTGLSSGYYISKPTKTGYTFGGYYTEINGGGTQYVDNNGGFINNVYKTIGDRTLYAKWTVNQYTVTYKDYFVDASNGIHGDPLGTTTKQKDYGSTVNATELGTDGSLNKYYSYYRYKGSSGNATVPANNDLVVYRYFWAWTDLNIYYANRSTQGGATVSFSSDGTNWVDRTNESQEEVIKPWGTTYYIKNIRPVNSATEEFDSVSSNLVWDSTNGYYKYTPTTAATNMNVYMKYKIFTITLDQAGGAAGTTAIYEKYNTGYYTNSTATTQMTTSANGITVPTKTGYTFGGYYTAANGGGTQYIDSNGKLTSSASATNFSSNGTLYAKWIAKNYTVTVNANGGTIPTTTGWTVASGSATATKSVTYDSAYGTLPEPTRTGYEFKGWNGKNKFDKSKYANLSDYDINATYKCAKIYLNPNTTYIVKVYGRNGWDGKGKGYLLLGSNTSLHNAPSVTRIAHNTNGIVDNYTYTTGSDGLLYIGYYSVTQENLDYIWANTDVQIEEGTTATPYEPYYVISTTNVTQDNDHTLYAKWEANDYTLTVNPNGGSWNNSTSNSTFTQKYGTDKTIAEPTRTGYTFSGWTVSGGWLGQSLHSDSSFASGTNGVSVYNNKSNGTVTHTRQEKSADNPIGNYEIKVQTSTNASPGLGGFVQSTNSAASQNYIHVFVAKLPKGYTFHEAMNATGDGRTVEWLTSKAGTGNFEFYAYQVNAGSTGTFNTFGHVYVDSASTAPTFYLAYSDIINIKNTKGTKYVFGGTTSLTANWTPNIYKITFDTQSATTSGHTAAYYLYNTVRDVIYNGTTYRNMYYYADAACTNPYSRTAITPPTKTGYVFGGYFTGTNGSGTQYINSSGGFINDVYKTVGDKTLYAYWKKTITLTQKHGGTTTTTQSYTLEDGETSHTFTLVTSQNSYDGWTFEGWTNSATPGAPDYGKTGTITLSSDKTVYATYSRVYTATFVDKNGTTDRTRTVQGTAYGNASAGGVGNQYPTITAPTVGTYTGWSVIGWRNDTESTSTPTVASGGQITGLSSNPTYYAVYSKGITVTLKTYNNQSTTKTGTVYTNVFGTIQDASISLGTTGNVTIDGVTYTPRHWSTSSAADASSSYALNATANISQDTTLYASYYKTYTGTFYYLSGTTKTYKTATANRYVNYTGTIVEGNYTVPSEATADSGNFVYQKISSQTTYNGSTATTKTPNTTFYTIYKRKNIKVYYNSNGGTGEISNQTNSTQMVNCSGDVGSISFTLKSNTFKKDKYVFTKWALGSASGTQYDEGGTLTVQPTIQHSGEYTMYAVWADANYVLVKDYPAHLYANTTTYYEGTKVGYYLTLADAVTAFNGMSKTSSTTAAIAALRDCTDNSEVTITNTTCELEICSTDHNVLSAGTGSNYEITRGKTINIGTGAKVLFRGGGKFSSTTSHIIDMTDGNVRIQNGQFKTTYQDTVTLTGGTLTTGPDITGYYPIIYTTDGSAIRNDGGAVNIISGQICHGDFGNDYTSSSWPAINNYSGNIYIGDNGPTGTKKILIIGKGSDAIINRGELSVLHTSAQLEIVSWGKTGIWQPSNATNATTWVGCNAKIVGDTHGMAIDGGYCTLGKVSGYGNYVIQSKGSSSNYAIKNSSSNKIIIHDPGRLMSYYSLRAFSNYSNVEYENLTYNAGETNGTYDGETVCITTISSGQI